MNTWNRKERRNYLQFKRQLHCCSCWSGNKKCVLHIWRFGLPHLILLFILTSFFILALFSRGIQNGRNKKVTNNYMPIKQFFKDIIYRFCCQGNLRYLLENYHLCQKYGSETGSLYNNAKKVFVFPPFKTGHLFSSKDYLPSSLKSSALYKFIRTRCQSCYVVETERHLPKRINERLVTGKKSHIFKCLLENPPRKNLCEGKLFCHYRFCIFF